MKLKKIIVFILLLAFMAGAFSKAVIVADFYANQATIAQTLCENKDKPMMRCCGKCQLRKRLAKEDNQEKSTPDRKAEYGNPVLFCHSFPAIIHSVISGFIRDITYAVFQSGAPIDQPSSVFRPPSC